LPDPSEEVKLARIGRPHEICSADGRGTSLGLAGWQVSAEGLDKTWVSAPEGFVGVMDAMVNLHSASVQLLQSKILRLEWIAKEEKKEV
jgi:hypothetical protein